ncbi:MAG: SCO family protein, partial [Alphaproteobacteria bacterium]
FGPRLSALALALFLWAPPGVASPGHDGESMSPDMNKMHAASGEPHLMGHGGQKFYMYPGRPTAEAGYDRIEAAYEAPSVTLYNEDGAAVELDRLLRRPGPVVLQFIFTSCATICPVLSAGLSQAQEALLARDPSTRLISISIDPEYDTPARLKAYAARYHAKRNWIFLTGRLGDIRKVITAFDALYQAESKMYHRPYTYLRAGPEAGWVRLEGLLAESTLLAEFETVLTADAGAGQQVSAGTP